MCANNIKFTIGTFTNESLGGGSTVSWGFSGHHHTCGTESAQPQYYNTLRIAQDKLTRSRSTGLPVNAIRLFT